MRGGDPTEAWFEEFFSTWEHRVGAFLVRLLGSQEAAEDVRQEAFLKTYTERHALRLKDSPELYLFAHARGLALHSLRSDRRRRAHQERARVPGGDAACDLAEALFVRDLLERYLAPSERAILILRYIHGFSSAEVGTIMEISPVAARKRISRITTELAQVVANTTDMVPARCA